MPLLPTAFAMAAAAGSVYDCLYLALAEREYCPVVAADRRFHATFAGGQLALARCSSIQGGLRENRSPNRIACHSKSQDHAACSKRPRP
jgi:hypothetical protein